MSFGAAELSIKGISVAQLRKLSTRACEMILPLIRPPAVLSQRLDSLSLHGCQATAMMPPVTPHSWPHPEEESVETRKVEVESP